MTENTIEEQTQYELLFQSAAMYRNKRQDVKSFVDYVLNNPNSKKTYQTFSTSDGISLDLTTDAILHNKNRHNLTGYDWHNIIDSLNNIVNATKNNRKNSYGNKGNSNIILENPSTRWEKL